MTLERRGCWGLPGGKIDAGETPYRAAVREFAEKTGQEFYPAAYSEMCRYTIDGCRFYVGTYRAPLAEGRQLGGEIRATALVRVSEVERALEAHDRLAMVRTTTQAAPMRQCMYTAFHT